MRSVAAGEGDARPITGAEGQPQYAGGGKTLPRRIATARFEPNLKSGLSPKNFVRQLRSNMTEAESLLWSALRGKRFEGFKFRRQVPIGAYFADFVCLEHRLIIEVDGGQHSESGRDARRDRWLTAEGFRILRFWNVDVFQALDGTLIRILEALKANPSPGARSARRPLLQGERQERT